MMFGVQMMAARHGELFTVAVCDTKENALPFA
jgi:hypothetical protein